MWPDQSISEALTAPRLSLVVGSGPCRRGGLGECRSRGGRLLLSLRSNRAPDRQGQHWGVIGRGLCGSLSTGPFTATLDAGSISFASINATASNGNFSAQYNGLDVYAPWLDTHLKGDATLQSGGGKEASLGFTFTGSPVVSKTYGNLAF